MIGYTSCLTAGLARQLMLAPAAPDIGKGIQSGLAAMRKLHLEGYGVRGEVRGDAGLNWPSPSGRRCGAGRRETLLRGNRGAGAAP